jgi:hypothetical protein
METLLWAERATSIQALLEADIVHTGTAIGRVIGVYTGNAIGRVASRGALL